MVRETGVNLCVGDALGLVTAREYGSHSLCQKYMRWGMNYHSQWISIITTNEWSFTGDFGHRR